VEDLQLALAQGPGSLTVSGRVPLAAAGEKAPREPMTLQIAADRWPASAVARFLLPPDVADAWPVGGQVTGGRLRALAVTSPQRLASFPTVPTVAELGYPGFEAATWSGLVAPAGTPPAIVARLNAEANKALGSSELKAKLAEEGSTPLGGTPQQFADFIRKEHAKWGAAVRDAGIKLD